MEATRKCVLCFEEHPLEKFMSGRSTRRVCYRCFGRQRRAVATGSLWAKGRELVTRARGRSKKTGFTDFEIDAEWFVTEWHRASGKCYYTGRAMVLDEGFEVVSIDRKDNTKGYSKKNSVLCCLNVNMMKRTMTEEEFTVWCRQVAVRDRAAKQRARYQCQKNRQKGSKPAPGKGRGAKSDAPEPPSAPEEG